MSNSNIDVSKFQEKKRRSADLADSYRRLSVDVGPVLREDKRGDYRKAAAVVASCGTLLDFTADTGELYRANFCKNRLCPMCAWRRSLKIFANLSEVMNYYDCIDDDHQYLFFTVTIKNVDGDFLHLALDELNAGHHRMTTNKAWKRRVLGCYRTLEITYNRAEQTYHPHMHYVLSVGGQYGRKTDMLYWGVDDWQRIWKQSARLEYEPSIEIHQVKQRKDGKQGRDAAIAEVAKYVCTDENYLYDNTLDTDRCVDVLTRSLYHRRLIGYNGIFGKLRRELKLQDEIDGDLTDGVVRSDLYVLIRRYHWSDGHYCPTTVLCYNDKSGRSVEGMSQEDFRREKPEIALDKFDK